VADDIEEAQTGEAEPKADKDDEEELLKRLKRWERLARNHWSSWRDEARLSYDFVAGNQWSSDDKAALLDQMRQPVTFNRVGPMVDAVLGAEILNRQEVQYLQREQGDAGVAELVTAADKWARDLSDTEDEESDAFADTVICGMGWSETRMDYQEDSEGRIIDDRIDPLEMWSDPNARKRNLVDRRYQIRARWRDRDDLPKEWLSKLPQVTEGSPNVEDIEQGWTGPKDDYDREEGAGKEPDKAERRRVWVRHFQWWDLETVYRLADPATNKAVTVDKGKMRKIARMFLDNGMKPPDFVKLEQKVFKQAFVAGNTILETGDIECKHFTFQCITGKRDRNANTFYGVVRAMIDPQMWGNKFFVQIMHILNTAAKGGLLYESDSFPNPRKALEDWSKPDAGIEVSRGALSGPNPKVKEREPRVFPTGTDKMMEFSLNNLPQTSGINMELLGLVERDQPGVLEMQRKKAGYAILAVFFDSLRRYRKNKGRVRLYFIQHYISDGRLIRIKGRDSTMQYVPLVQDDALATYDVVVDEAPMSPNQKEAVWAMMMGMMPMLSKLNVPPKVWQIMLEYSPLPSAVSTEINKAMDEQAQQPPPPDPALMKVQAEMQASQQEHQMDMAAQQQEMAIKERQAQLDTQLAQLKLQVEVATGQQKLALQREQADLALQKQHGEMMLAGIKAHQDMAVAQIHGRLKTQQMMEQGQVKAQAMRAQARAKPRTGARR
jgi:hypothetical protein